MFSSRKYLVISVKFCDKLHFSHAHAASSSVHLQKFLSNRSKNRKAWVVPACLSTKDETMHVTFAALGHVGHIVTDDGSKQDEQVLVNVTCLPLYSILMALDNPTVDYFSLDVEGFELDILKTIPFDKVDIKVL